MSKKPFSNDYVIRETLKHMQKSVEISRGKTLARMDDFKDDPEMLSEFMTALSNLNKFEKMLVEIREANKSMIGEKE